MTRNAQYNTNFRTGTLSSTEIVRSLFLGKMKQVDDYQSKSFQIKMETV